MKLMKFSSLYILNALFIHITIINAAQDQLLAVLLMVKDEEQVMQKTLQPYIDAGIDSYLILDTGSTDKTIEITQQLFKKNNIQHGHIIEQPFVDFATSRNYAIEQAEKLLPDTTFFLMIDAEWYINDVPALLNFCNEQKHSQEYAFLNLIHVKHENTNFHTIRLFKPHYNVKFEGVVHETILLSNQSKTPSTIYFVYDSSKHGRQKTNNRFIRDKQLLIKEHENNPHNKRTVFYLAQTYACLSDWKNAYKYYKKRTDFEDNTSECFLAHYKCGQISAQFKDYMTAHSHYIKAHNMAPYRAEPLVDLAAIHFNLRNYKQAFNFALKAVQLPYPDNDTFSVELNYYMYTRYEILANISLYVGQYKIGKQATIEALKSNPNNSQLQHLLKIYQS